jgi:hypothetical protein
MADIIIDEPDSTYIAPQTVKTALTPSMASPVQAPSASGSSHWYTADEIVDALVVHVKDKDTRLQMVHKIHNSFPQGERVNWKDFLRSLGDRDIKEHNLKDLKINRRQTSQPSEILRVTPFSSQIPILSPSAPSPEHIIEPSDNPIVPMPFYPTVPLKRIKWGNLILAFVIAVILVVIGYVLVKKNKLVDENCAVFCTVPCTLLTQDAIDKCTSCGKGSACNPMAAGYVKHVSEHDKMPEAHPQVDDHEHVVNHEHAVDQDQEHVDDHELGASWMSKISQQLSSIQAKTNGVTKKFFAPKEHKSPQIKQIKDSDDMRVHVLADEGLIWTKEDRITFSSLTDATLTITVYLHELADVDNGGINVITLPEKKYFATARAVGSRAHFQSSGIVEDGTLIRFGSDYVEVNAILSK